MLAPPEHTNKGVLDESDFKIGKIRNTIFAGEANFVSMQNVCGVWIF